MGSTGLETVDVLPRATMLNQTAIQIGCGACKDVRCVVVSGDRATRDKLAGDLRDGAELTGVPVKILRGGSVESVGVEATVVQCDEPGRPCQDPEVTAYFSAVLKPFIQA